MNKIIFKNITPLSLYNITQDYCHYVIIDLRKKEEFLQNFIRQSYWINIDPNLESIEELIKFLEKKDEIAKMNDINDKKKVKVRRLILIKDKNMEKEQVEDFAKKLKIVNLFNRFAVFDQIEEFKNDYPFLVLSIKNQEVKNSKTFKEIQDTLMKEQKQKILYANSNFPLCVYKKQFFYGNKFHSNSQKLLKDLNIKFIYEIVEDKDNINEIQKQLDNYFQIEINPEKFIDFELLWEQIEQQVNDDKVLFIESNPKKHFPSFLIVYQIIKQKLSINISTIKTLQLLGQPSMNLLSYNQAMNFIPGSVKRI